MKRKTPSLLKSLVCAVLSATVALCPAASYLASEPETAAEETAAAEVATRADSDDALSEADAGAFEEAWNQLSQIILDNYRTALSKNDSAAEMGIFQANRLTVEPAALRLLNLLSETVLKTDLSWIEELGIDFIPTVQTETVPVYNGYRMIDADTFIPGLSAVLHVNGKKIITSDVFVNNRNQMLCLTLPELVSGEAVTALPRSSLSYSAGQYLRQIGIFVNSPEQIPDQISRLPQDLSRLIPDPDLMEMILESAGGLSEYYQPESTEQVLVSADDISEECTAYTGKINIRDSMSLLPVLLERAEEDEAFRDALKEYLSDLYALNFTNQILSGILWRAGLGSYLNDFRHFAEDAQVMAALFSGGWKFRNEELNQRGSSGEAAKPAAVAEAKEAVESEEEETFETEDENAFHPEDIQAIPGKAYTWEEYQQLPDDTLSLLRRGLMGGSVILTGDRSIGDDIFICYEAMKDLLMEQISILQEETDPEADCAITTKFNSSGKLTGLCLGLLYAESELGRVEFGWPVSDADKGFAAAVSGGGQDVGSVIVKSRNTETDKEFCITMSEGGEPAASFIWSDIKEDQNRHLHAEAIQHQPYEETLFSGDLELTREEDLDTLTVSLQGGEEVGTVLLSGQRTSEADTDLYSMNLDYNGSSMATLEGSIDKAAGTVSFEMEIPTDDRFTMTASLSGSFEPATGNGSYEVSLSENSNWSYYQGAERELLSYDIETEGLKRKKDGSFSGTVSVGITGTGQEVNPIPNGMKLVFGNDMVQIADDSAVYMTFSKLDESEYLTSEEAKERIAASWERTNNAVYSYHRGQGFGSNWNIAFLLNRLMDAGMPADQFSNLPIPLDMSDLRYELEDLLF